MMAVLLDRTDDLNAMLLAAFDNQLGPNVRAVHKLAGRELFSFGQLVLPPWQMFCVRCIRGHSIDVCDQMRYIA